MKRLILLFIAAMSLAEAFGQANTPSVPMVVNPAGATPSAPINPAASPSAPVEPVAGGDDTIPGAAYPASRYAALWTKSPFAVATSETVGEESPDYLLVGIANFDGISYASVLDAKPPQNHFLISTDHPMLGMTLKSINLSKDGSNTYAVVEKDGQALTLKLQQPPPSAGGVAGNQPIPQMTYPGQTPGNMAPQIPMPGANPTFPGNASVRPFPRFHRPPIHLPTAQPIQPPPVQPPPPQPSP